MFDVDIDYYHNGLLQKLIPGFPPRITIGFYYQEDIDDFDRAIAVWQREGCPDLAEYRTDWGYEIEDWMPLARGFWDTGFAPCSWIGSVDDKEHDWFEYEQCDIGPCQTVESHREYQWYSRSAWLREIVDQLSADINEWEWTPTRISYRVADDMGDHENEPRAFKSPLELLMYKDYFLNWYEEWVKQGRPVRALSFDGDTDHPVFGELEYEER